MFYIRSLDHDTLLSLNLVLTLWVVGWFCLFLVLTLLLGPNFKVQKQACTVENVFYFLRFMSMFCVYDNCNA